MTSLLESVILTFRCRLLTVSSKSPRKPERALTTGNTSTKKSFLGKNKKKLECSETQEYAKTFSDTENEEMLKEDIFRSV